MTIIIETLLEEHRNIKILLHQSPLPISTKREFSKY